MKAYDKKGLTLVEVITTAIIASFVLAGTATYIAFSSQSYNKTVARTNIQSALTMIESAIKRDVQKGASVSVSSLGKTLEVIDGNGGVLETYKFENNKFIKGASNTNNYILAFNADFLGNFTETSAKNLAMKIQIQIKNNNNGIIDQSGDVNYYVKCRNHKMK